jgi:hypothetical protein
MKAFKHASFAPSLATPAFFMSRKGNVPARSTNGQDFIFLHSFCGKAKSKGSFSVDHLPVYDNCSFSAFLVANAIVIPHRAADFVCYSQGLHHI